MSRRWSTGCVIVVASVLWITGCGSSVIYYGDTTPKMETLRQEYVRNNPENRFNEDILAGRVQPGMSRLQVRVAWGEPDRMSKGDRAGIDQVWTYAEDEPSRGESLFQMRFYQGVLHEIATTRRTSELTANETRNAAQFDDEIHTSATITPVK